MEAAALARGFRYDFENKPKPTDREPPMPGFEAMFNAFVTLLVTVDPPEGLLEEKPDDEQDGER